MLPNPNEQRKRRTKKAGAESSAPAPVEAAERPAEAVIFGGDEE
jgi:hypothetical protein